MSGSIIVGGTPTASGLVLQGGESFPSNITVNWATKIIFVPRASMTLIQSMPTEIRQLDLNWFRMQLKDLEDNADGMVFPDTHRHNTEVLLGGIVYARVIEIINGYTITFEDGQYAVDLVGANSNVGDVVNVNQVSVRSHNSAGLISSQDIEFSSYENGVTIDLLSPYSGTLHPVGTRRQPVNNLSDAILIAEFRGLNNFYILGNADIDDSGDYHGKVFVGESINKTILNIAPAANVERAEFRNCTLEGTLDGQAFVKDCAISTLNYINGIIEDSVLNEGVILLGGNREALFLNCWRGASGAVPIIDMGGSGQALSLRNFSGSITLRNKTGPEPVLISLLAGIVTLDSTVTDGLITVSGNGAVVDNSTGSAIVNTDNLLNSASIGAEVFDNQQIVAGLPFRVAQKLMMALQLGLSRGSTGRSADDTVQFLEALAESWSTDKIRVTALVDQFGNRKQIQIDLT